jgi:hypothetical protein
MSKSLMLAFGVIVGAVAVIVAGCLRCEAIPIGDGHEYVLDRWTGKVTIRDVAERPRP